MLISVTAGKLLRKYCNEATASGVRLGEQSSDTDAFLVCAERAKLWSSGNLLFVFRGPWPRAGIGADLFCLLVTIGQRVDRRSKNAQLKHRSASRSTIPTLPAAHVPIFLGNHRRRNCLDLCIRKSSRHLYPPRSAIPNEFRGECR
jgi:hypothetical protein